MGQHEKDAKYEVEMHEVMPEKGIDSVAVEKDAFGARKKIDPKEIKLVRKLDTYIMVSQVALLDMQHAHAHAT